MTDSRGLAAALHRTGVIWRFEALQMLRPAALAWSCALAAFPAVLLAGLRSLEPAAVEASGAIDFWMFLLIPTLVCLLGLLLTVTSTIHSEVENRTWIYLAVRPGAKASALAGKYLFAVSWVFAIAATATVLTALLLWGVVPPAAIARTLALSALACFGYGALYLLLGVAFFRIGMVVAIAYTLLVELLVGTLPAIVNRGTVSYHLRSVFLGLLPDGATTDLPEAFQAGSGFLPGHVAVLAVVTATFFAAGLVILRRREIATGSAD